MTRLWIIDDCGSALIVRARRTDDVDLAKYALAADTVHLSGYRVYEEYRPLALDSEAAQLFPDAEAGDAAE